MSRDKEKILKGRTILGTPGAGGRGIGRPLVINSQKTVVKPEKIADSETQTEFERVNEGIRELTDEFKSLKELSSEQEVANIVESQIQVLHDPELKKSIKQNIFENKYQARYAVFSSFNTYIQLLENVESEWMRDRSVDVASVRDQLIDKIRNYQPEELNADYAVVFADELSPTEMIKLSRFKLAGIVTQKGGLTSHVVILAQSLGIPCVIGTEWQLIKPERFSQVMIDGDVGSILFEPTEKLKDEYKNYQQEKLEEERTALQWASMPNRTTCGSSFTIRGNIEFLSELPRLATHGASGVGLLRTETILFESHGFDVPTQIEFYRKVAESSAPHPVVIRLFDAGGDKLPEIQEKEHNPFLGWRGIRMLLDKPDLLMKQYEAILRVSAEFPGKLKILVPMISHLEQIDRAKELLEEVKTDLDKQGVEFDRAIPFGIMIEVPGIALMAAEAAESADFFSIGTNDLTQYMLAVDRGNSKISSLYQPAHPSVWKVIKHVIDASDQAGIPLSICGEMASNPFYAACFLGMGLHDLSMTTNSILAVKEMLCTHDLEEFKERSDEILAARTFADVNLVFNEWKKSVDLNQV